MLDDFLPTPQRSAIVESLDKAQAELARAAELLAADPVAAARAPNLLDLAQLVAARRSLVAQDWALAGGAQAA